MEHTFLVQQDGRLVKGQSSPKEEVTDSTTG